MEGRTRLCESEGFLLAPAFRWDFRLLIGEFQDG